MHNPNFLHITSMMHISKQSIILGMAVVVVGGALVYSLHGNSEKSLQTSGKNASVGAGADKAAGQSGEAIPLKEAKLNIEHNATDNDTGFQGAIDSEGWEKLTVTGPDGPVLSFNGLGTVGNLGLTELFFETVEPENKDVSIAEMLKKLPEGNYTIDGPTIEVGERKGKTAGVAWLTHAIPAGTELLSPQADVVVSAEDDLLVRWTPVTKTITGANVKIIAYQLIIDKDEDPHKHMIGKRGLSMYLPASVTSIIVPKGVLEPKAKYNWEVLAVEESGNQTLSSSAFSTR
jgi:hypothetical protein